MSEFAGYGMGKGQTCMIGGYVGCGGLDKRIVGVVDGILIGSDMGFARGVGVGCMACLEFGNSAGSVVVGKWFGSFVGREMLKGVECSSSGVGRGDTCLAQ